MRSPLPACVPACVPDAATIGAMTARRARDAHLGAHLNAPAPTLPLHDLSDVRRETAILAEVDSGYPWDER